MVTAFDNLVSTVICAACEAIEDGHIDARIEIVRADVVGVSVADAAAVAAVASQDRRIEKIGFDSTSTSFRYVIHLFADAHEIHAAAVAQGLCPAGLRNVLRDD